LAWTSFLLYAFIALTDKLDGYLARSRNEVTDFGKFIDPIADKLCVTCALLYLLELGMCPSWAVLLVVGREFLISGLRMIVAAKGVVVAASDLGKWKTATTMIAICGLLLVVTLVPGWFTTVCRWTGFVSMLIALALTAWSGLDYFVKCWPYVAGDK
jgi:CDP-diacylglycerol--glycerol-3-phosphate 3-phosphatidyltransferase